MKGQKQKKPMGRPKGKPRTAAEIAADAKRPGRPSLAGDENVSKAITMRLTPTDYLQFSKDAMRAGMGHAAYIRHCWQAMRASEYSN